ncbi:hypothetical protein RRG08_065478 [Elysia crispata]|uniref:Uncharacterized protein n=1 Tax=Elysia crispata TaxID=231223 RepID=A0AAE1E2J5_9GAST|nr:hypothetical protein RRG08_065478 [Elysia crispata]
MVRCQQFVFVSDGPPHALSVSAAALTGSRAWETVSEKDFPPPRVSHPDRSLSKLEKLHLQGKSLPGWGLVLRHALFTLRHVRHGVEMWTRIARWITVLLDVGSKPQEW